MGETHRAIEATFRIERALLIARLARMVRNVDLAEELAQEGISPRTGGSLQRQELNPGDGNLQRSS